MEGLVRALQDHARQTWHYSVLELVLLAVLVGVLLQVLVGVSRGESKDSHWRCSVDGRGRELGGTHWE